MSRGSVLVFVLLGCVLGAVRATGGVNPTNQPGGVMNSIDAFSVAEEESNERSVELEGPSGKKLSCVFKYQTKVASKDAGGEEETAKVGMSAQQAIGRLRGKCIQKQDGYWTYEVCVGKHVKQWHDSDVYMLGKTMSPAAADATTQEYTDGTPCGALAGREPRRANVAYFCSDSERLETIREDSTCVYQVVVSTPSVCDHPAFEKSSQQFSSEDQQEEWYLELERFPDTGGYACSVQLAGEKMRTSNVHFDRFSVQLVQSGSKMPHPHTLSAVVARHGNRQSFEAAEVANVRGSSQLASTDKFTGNMEFVRVVTDQEI